MQQTCGTMTLTALLMLGATLTAQYCAQGMCRAEWGMPQCKQERMIIITTREGTADVEVEGSAIL